MEEAQLLATEAVLRVRGGRSLEAALLALRQAHPALSAQQRALIQELSFGTLRFLGYLDALLDALLHKPVRDEQLASLLRVARARRNTPWSTRRCGPAHGSTVARRRGS